MVEGLLKRKELLEEDLILTLDFAVYEVVNSIWKHQFVLKDLDDGKPFVSILYGLIESGRVRPIGLDQKLMDRAYAVAGKNNVSVYDSCFVVLAMESGLELMTFDARQSTIMKRESKTQF